jgi:hypothetical protein
MRVPKDRARPFSRKHRRYWIPVTGGMILIGVINVALGFCSYHQPPDVHERIVPDVPQARTAATTASPQPATGCLPSIAARVQARLPGATITACAPDRVTVVHDDHTIELEIAGGDITSTAQTLTLPEIPATVMRAFAIAYPRTIPSGAIVRTRQGAEPTYELAFPPGAAHRLATLRADGSIAAVR